MSERTAENQLALTPFYEMLEKKLPSDKAGAVAKYAEYSYRFTTQDELEERGLENLYGATLSGWQFIQSYAGPTPKIRVYNPDLEKSGWRSQHTVIELLQPDMPFLVDSIRMELHRLGLVVHTIHNSVMRVQRKGENLEAILDDDAEGGSLESVIYLETDRKSDQAELTSIKKLLEIVLSHVHVAVADFPRMVEQAKKVSAALIEAGRPEESEFIEWMLDDHFTFLGYDEVEVTDTHINHLDDLTLGVMSLKSAHRKNRALADLSDAEISFLNEPRILMFAKDPDYSRVHRPAHTDRIIFKEFDQEGRLVKKLRFHGLFTSPVYTKQVMSIPVVRKRAESVLNRCGFDLESHNGKKVLQILNDLPRDELLLARGEELHATVMGIFSLHDRRKVRLLMRKDRCNQFVTFLYYVPRDLISTDLRLKVEALLMKATQASEVEFTTTFSESVLARVHYVLRTDPQTPIDFDLHALEKEVAKISRDWRDELHEVLTEAFGEEEGNNLQTAYADGFASAYREHFSPENAIYDINRLEELNENRLVNMSFYRKLEQDQAIFRFKLFNRGEPLVLSDVIPVLENLGMRVVGEHPYEVTRADGIRFWIHDFTLVHQGDEPVVLEEVKDVFNDAFANIWCGRAENDEFNHLVIAANLSWREVAMLRAYARYCKQIRMGFSQPYIAGTLTRHIHVTKLLVTLFKARFEPSRNSSGKRDALAGRIESSVIDALEKVDNINEDQILRRFLELMKATLRTSYYQRDKNGEYKDCFSFKLSPRDISNIPLPRPMFEVFVYSARVEGVHLRGGKVARGGLRWSDRVEDFRTEVLGLVKAQQVKNSVIVPVGAKGGFVAKQLPTQGGR
ncbi:MAG: NAD-glutamate dehydrogenase domain-containing protein, partial [Pontibacterium sp.]